MADEEFAGYARLYAGLAPQCLVMSVLPPFTVVRVGNRISEYGTVWEMAGRAGAGLLAAVLLFGLVACLATGAFHPRSSTPPAGVAVCAAVVAVMLLTRTGTGSPKPELTAAGILGIVVALGTAALAIGHLWHLARRHKEQPDRGADQRQVTGGPG
jgi:hypothetical protein